MYLLVEVFMGAKVCVILFFEFMFFMFLLLYVVVYCCFKLCDVMASFDKSTCVYFSW